MSKRDSIIFFLSSLVLILVIYLMANKAQKDYLQSSKDLQKFEVEAKSLAKLKTKFGKKSDERIIKAINRISANSKDFKKSNSRVLVYENLEASPLANILRKIENSTLIVKSLEIKRETPQNATLRLEIAK
jgi:hypothetical protein